MKFYRVSVELNDGEKVVWVTSMTKAKKERTKMRRQYGDEVILRPEIDTINFSIKKVDIVRWLNSHLAG